MLKRRIELSAPAKVNLHLGVYPHGSHPGPWTGSRSDSRTASCSDLQSTSQPAPSPEVAGAYHEVATILHTVDLADTLVVELHVGNDLSKDAPAFELVCDPPLDVATEDNLVTRAARALACRLHRELVGPGEHLVVRLTKNSPDKAGLGGGSSDAAAMIRALCQLWEEDPLSSEVHSEVAGLGADVPFFLEGGCALMDGRGDHLVTRFQPLDAAIVLVKAPDTGVPTAACYGAFDKNPTLPAEPGALIAMLAGESPDKVRGMAEHLFNNLEVPARTVSPDISEHLDWLAEQGGVLGSSISGSGAAGFAICEGDAAAARIARDARTRGYWSHAGRLR